MKLTLTNIILLLGVFLVPVIDVDAQISNSGSIKISRNIVYSPPPGGDRQKAQLDIYYSSRRKSHQRLMVFVHGGSWKGGDKNNLQKARGLISYFVNHGYVVAAPNFRLVNHGSSSYIDQARDIAHAIAFLQSNATQYGVTEPGLVLVGYSSGAHLVALLAADERYLREVGLSSNNLHAVISFDVHAYDVPFALGLMRGSELERNIPLMQSVFGYSKSQQLVGSPVSYINESEVPPSLLISAGRPLKSSKGFIAKTTTQRYAALLRKAGHRAYARHFSNETHSSLVMDFGRLQDGPTQVVDAFLQGLSK